MKMNKTPHVAICNLPHLKVDGFHFNTLGPEPNVNSKIDVMEGLFSIIPERFLDFLDIATFVYCADQFFVRSQGISDLHGERWYRGINFIVGVRDISFWQDDAITEQLCSLLSFLSGEDISFEFQKLPIDKARDGYFNFVGKWDKREKPTQVMLYSGGLDSLGGALMESLNNGNRTVLVRHKSHEKFKKRHEQLNEALLNKCKNNRPLIVALEVNKDRKLTKEYTQRTRSFLYFSLASTIAYLLDLSNVKFYENGPVSINLPMTHQVLGSMATRTTHPKVLYYFQQLISKIAERPFIVENPFLKMTKGNVLDFIHQCDCQDLIPLSTSCAHIGFAHCSNKQPQCGVCSQCIDRRFALEACGLSILEPGSRYKHDFFAGSLGQLKQEDRATLISYIERAIRIIQMSYEDFQLEFTSTALAAKYMPMGSAIASKQIFEVYKKHAAEVEAVCTKIVEKNAKNILRGNLPADSLARVLSDNPEIRIETKKTCTLNDDPEVRLDTETKESRSSSLIERIEEDGIEIWKIKGEVKHFPFKENSQQHRFLMILYNLFIANENEWIPHETFMQQAGWTPKQYFGKDRHDSGLAQKRFSEIRKALGIKISFDRKKGCRICSPVKS